MFLLQGVMWKHLCNSEKRKSSISNPEGKGEECHREPEDFEFVIFKHEIVIKCFNFLKLGDWLALLNVHRVF